MEARETPTQSACSHESRPDSDGPGFLSPRQWKSLLGSSPIEFRVNGISMLPTLRSGDRVLIEPLPERPLRQGDIAAFWRENLLLVHRYLGNGRFQGDGLPYLDGIIPSAHVVGIVHYRIQDGNRIALGSSPPGAVWFRRKMKQLQNDLRDRLFLRFRQPPTSVSIPEKMIEEILNWPLEDVVTQPCGKIEKKLEQRQESDKKFDTEWQYTHALIDVFRSRGRNAHLRQHALERRNENAAAWDTLRKIWSENRLYPVVLPALLLFQTIDPRPGANPNEFYASLPHDEKRTAFLALREFLYALRRSPRRRIATFAALRGESYAEVARRYRCVLNGVGSADGVVNVENLIPIPDPLTLGGVFTI